MTTARTKRFLRHPDLAGPQMHTSERWKQEFIAQMECARCRTKEGIELYNYDGTIVDVKKYTVDELIERIPRMDTWCDSCGVRFSSRITGEGRRTRKKDAAFVAQLRANTHLAAIFDTHSFSETKTITKRELIDKVKERPCQVCNQSFPLAVMDLHHIKFPKVATMTQMLLPRYTLQDVISEIEKCAVVCSNCHRMITAGIIDPDLENVRIEGNIFTSF